MVTVAAGGARFMTNFKGPCGGYIFRRCFVAGTQIVVGEGELGSTVAIADAGTSTSEENSSLSVAGVSTVVIATIGGTVLLERR